MYTISRNTKLISYALMVIGLIATVLGFATDAHRAWPSLLINNYYFLAIAAFAIFFIALQYASEAAWATPFKRVAEAITSYFIYGGVIILLIIIAGKLHWNHIWHWMAEGIMDPNSEHYDKIIAGKEGYLNFPFFFARAVWHKTNAESNAFIASIASPIIILPFCTLQRCLCLQNLK